MKQVFIISSNFYDISRCQFTIGGIQTYIKDLNNAIIKQGHKSCLVQFGDADAEQEITPDGCIIRFEKYIKGCLKSRDQRTFDGFYSRNDSPDSVFIIDTDQRDIKSDKANVIQIQHGITFDIPGNMISGIWGKNRFLQRINKQIRCWRNTSRLTHVPNTVCVDYNYYNWFRTQGTIPDDLSVKVIPNYAGALLSAAEVDNKLKSSHSIIKIVFARRFVDYRGTRLMMEATRCILAKFENVEVTFAGGGPLENEIKSLFLYEKRVHITKYESTDSVAFHRQFDVAVVPTIYSEGTSLSLCEAMAAGCIPIASCVGGMSNIILNGYNGLLILPNVEELKNAITSVIKMTDENRRLIAKRAYDTARVSFSRSRWEQEWISFLKME